MVDNVKSVRLDVELLKKDMSTVTTLCEKMDKALDKFVDQQDKIVNQVYHDMENMKNTINSDIKEINSRITSVNKDLSDKVELSERRIMDEIKSLRSELVGISNKESEKLEKLTAWKWMIVGGLSLVGWLLSEPLWHFIELMQHNNK